MKDDGVALKDVVPQLPVFGQTVLTEVPGDVLALYDEASSRRIGWNGPWDTCDCDCVCDNTGVMPAAANDGAYEPYHCTKYVMLNNVVAVACIV